MIIFTSGTKRRRLASRARHAPAPVPIPNRREEKKKNREKSSKKGEAQGGGGGNEGGRRKETAAVAAAALCWARQVNLLLSQRGLSLLAVLIFVVLLDVGVKTRGARIPSPVAAPAADRSGSFTP